MGEEGREEGQGVVWGCDQHKECGGEERGEGGRGLVHGRWVLVRGHGASFVRGGRRLCVGEPFGGRGRRVWAWGVV